MQTLPDGVSGVRLRGPPGGWTAIPQGLPGRCPKREPRSLKMQPRSPQSWREGSPEASAAAPWSADLGHYLRQLWLSRVRSRRDPAGLSDRQTLGTSLTGSDLPGSGRPLFSTPPKAAVWPEFQWEQAFPV